MNNKQNFIPPKEYKIDIMSTYPQTFIDGSTNAPAGKFQSNAQNFCQNCAMPHCQNCQNAGNGNLLDGQGGFNFQELLPMLLKSLGGKMDMSSVMSLMSNFTPNQSQNGASGIQNILNLVPKLQKKERENSPQNETSAHVTAAKNSPSKTNESQIDKFEIIKEL